MIAILLLLAVTAAAQVTRPDGGAVRPGTLPAAWITGGPKCMEVPSFQVHEYNPDFYILRESGCINYEKPFLYLLFGADRALLVDTGAGQTNVAEVIADLRAKWLQRNQRASIPLVVAHSHGHGDHTSGDAQLAMLPETTVIGTAAPAVAEFFGFRDWPTDQVTFDLGNRVLDVLGIPGHQEASIAIYDRQTGVMLTGDTVYPGRLYVAKPDEFVASIHRLVEFTRGKVVTHLFGAHIEQTATPYLEFPIGSLYQPNEHRLELTRGNLLEVEEALEGMHGEIHQYALRDLTIYPNTPQSSQDLRRVRTETQAAQKARMWDQNAPSAIP